jgi:hypothetical protein
MTSHQTAFSRLYIMRDLDKIINLCSGPDKRIAEFSPINTAIRADFDAVFENHPAIMGYQPMRTVDKGVPEPRCANRRIRLNNAGISDLTIVINDNMTV